MEPDRARPRALQFKFEFAVSEVYRLTQVEHYTFFPELLVQTCSNEMVGALFLIRGWSMSSADGTYSSDNYLNYSVNAR